jgi:hypothetical protein
MKITLTTSLSLWLYSPLDLGRLFSFLILSTVGRTPWTGDQPVARPLRTHRTTQTQNKRTKTSIPRVGFESTTTVRVLDRAAAVIGTLTTLKNEIRVWCKELNSNDAPNVAVELLAFLLRIRGVSDSDLGSATVYTDYCSSLFLSVALGECHASTQTGWSFPSTLRWSSCHSTVQAFSLSCW